jgi:oligogalacturonide lyase
VAKGDEHPPEGAVEMDAATGARVRRVTGYPAIHHHPFFLAPAFDDAMRRLLFVSHRTGRPEVFAEVRETGRLVQLTERPDLDEWSLVPAADGSAAFYTAAGVGYRLDLGTLEESAIVRFPDAGPKRVGGVAGEMGTTALSRDGRWWAVHHVAEGGAGKELTLVNTATGEGRVVARGPAIGHAQFCPGNPERISYAGPHTARMRLTRWDGLGDRLVMEHQPGQWITHEIWIPRRNELAFVDWPHAVRAVNPDTGAVRTVAEFNAWHAAWDKTGRYLIADTNFPDIGLQLFDTQTGRRTTVCHPGASNAGDHWGGPFPYANGPIKVYAPQHTHPHPVFAPDGRSVVFTSDRTGYAQVYEADISPLLVD